MPMPPCTIPLTMTIHDSSSKRCTHNDVVRAGHSRATARGASPDANDTDRAAVEGNEAGHVLDGDAEQAEEGGARSRVRLCPVSVLILLEEKNRTGARTDSVLSQHWTPLLGWLAAVGVATARRERESVEKIASLENIVGSARA